VDVAFWQDRTTTPSGMTITCDGCRQPTGPVDAATMVHDVRHPEKWAVGGRPGRPGELHFIVCPPRPDGTNPCLVLAQLDEEMDTPPGPDCGCAACLTGHGHRVL
jgi:hypothetical protein